MVQYLNELRHLPNYHLMLSTDPSTGPALPGWTECGVDVAYSRNFKACPYFESGDNKCYKCGYCYGKHGNVNVAIKAHSLRKSAVPVHERFTAQRIERYGFNPLGPEMSVRPRRIPVRRVR
jgi:hypothetical protein